MPGWYVHGESAKRTVDRLRAGNVNAEFPKDNFSDGVSYAKYLGDIGYKWRNYLAVGAIGPDIFFLLPDYTSNVGNVILTVVEWIRDVWDPIDKQIVSKWEKWVTPGVINELTAGILKEVGEFFKEISTIIQDAILDLIAQLWDWYGLLQSGVPQGYGDNMFYWSDIFHYRKTYQFARQLFKNATDPNNVDLYGKTEQLQAFALGWMSHCATDVIGHSFVNEKSGGPWRLHWQRHHLVENHIDAFVYDSLHGSEPYGELDTSCLHFRLAYRKRVDPPYNGVEDAPAYDYFSGSSGEPYPLGDSTNESFARENIFDLDTGDLPLEVCNLILKTMKDIYGDREPKIMTNFSPEFHEGSSGRPSVSTIQNTFSLLYTFIKIIATGGYSPPRPIPPDLIGDHSPPYPPGSDGGVSDNTARGEDPDSHSDDDWTFFDYIFAIFGWVKYIFDFGVWLVTLPAGVLADLLTYPLREVIYEYVALPLWSLYIAVRKPLVMAGFLMPKHEEISRGLVALGISPTGPLEDLAAALGSPDGDGSVTEAFDEPSGRANPSDSYGADPAYPRAIIKDDFNLIASIVGYLKPDLFCGEQKQPSEFLRPWKYPQHNNSKKLNGWEPSLTHPGPFLQGQDAGILFGNFPGDQSARKDFEKARSPQDTEDTCDANLPFGRHLGDPVDYGVYLVSRLLDNNFTIPDFNLDSDRGYGYHCWDWTRHSDSIWDPITNKHYDPEVPNPNNLPPPPPDDPNQKFYLKEPCTVPEQFCQGLNSPKYDANIYREIYYLSNPDDGTDANDPGCKIVGPGHGTVTGLDKEKAKVPPEGEQ